MFAIFVGKDGANGGNTGRVRDEHALARREDDQGHRARDGRRQVAVIALRDDAAGQPLPEHLYVHPVPALRSPHRMHC